MGGNFGWNVGHNDTFLDVNLTVSSDAVEFDSLRFDNSSFVGAFGQSAMAFTIFRLKDNPHIVGTSDAGVETIPTENTDLFPRVFAKRPWCYVHSSCATHKSRRNHSIVDMVN